MPKIEKIGEGAFSRYSTLGGAPIFTAVVLPDTLTFIGKGAGSLPTATAIVLDIVDIIENRCLICYDNKNKFKIN